jgi:TPR repeat protein
MKRLFLISILLLSSAAWGQSLEAANAAYDRKDYATALRAYQSLAARGDASARNNLGMMHYRGEGVPQDRSEAVKWYRLAAAQGNAEAQSNLGLMYDRGRGVPQDYVTAHMWFNLVAARPNANAARSRDLVAKEMTPQQIADAQKRARECLARNYKGC